MQEQLLKVIKESLPEAVAGEMKEFIKQAEQTKRDLKSSEKTIKAQESKIDTLEKDIDGRNGVIADKESEIGELISQIDECEDCKDRYMRLEYEERLQAAQRSGDMDRVNDMKEIVSLVFKSPVYRKHSVVSESKSKSVPYTDTQNGLTQRMYDTETQNKTVTFDEKTGEDDDNME